MKSNEKLIMEEMIENGPVVMSFYVPKSFWYYESGIFHSVEAADWILNQEE